MDTGQQRSTNKRVKIDYEKQLQEVTNKKEDIERMMRRGKDCIVLEYGSHQLKYGFAQQNIPNKLRMLIAYKKDEQTQNVVSS